MSFQTLPFGTRIPQNSSLDENRKQLPDPKKWKLKIPFFCWEIVVTTVVLLPVPAMSTKATLWHLWLHRDSGSIIMESLSFLPSQKIPTIVWNKQDCKESVIDCLSRMWHQQWLLTHQIQNCSNRALEATIIITTIRRRCHPVFDSAVPRLRFYPICSRKCELKETQELLWKPQHQ